MIDTDIVHQYRIIAAGAGWTGKTSRGRLRFDGADRQAFLQALLTNEIASLRAGSGTYALYLTPQGRMIADLHVFLRPDHLIVDAPSEVTTGLARTFDSLVFAEDVRVTDVSRAMGQISVIGGGAVPVLARALSVAEGAVRDLQVWSQIDVAGGFLACTDDVQDGSWDVVIEQGALPSLIAALGQAGAVAMSEPLVEAMRIDAGRPKFGVDMTTETIPLEAGLLDRAISQTKGCYVGQEVIIRVLHRGAGRVAKRLVRLQFDETSPGAPVPAAGAALAADGRDIGHVTSASWSLRGHRAIALGYVHRDAAEPGRRLTASWADGSGGSVTRIDAVVTGLAA